MTISELELSVQAGLESMRNTQLDPEAASVLELLLPEGLTPVVELVNESGDHKRGDSTSLNWNPQSDRIVISFRPVRAQESTVSSSSLGRRRFQPIAVRGESVSATLLRDRGSL